MSSTCKHTFIFDPLSQFEITEILTLKMPILNGLNISITNITIYIIIATVMVTFFLITDSNYLKAIANRWNIIKECVYDTVHSIIRSQINNTYGQIFFPFIFALFLFILSNNIIGMIPYSFASTSHFILTFGLSFTIVIGATLLGLYLYNLELFSLFVPKGCPLPLVPLLVLIEFISYLSRNVSLGLRLGANILSGHMLLNILSGFTYKIMGLGLPFSAGFIAPLCFIILFAGLELCITFIQAQVFAVLACNYIKDGIDLH